MLTFIVSRLELEVCDAISSHFVYILEMAAQVATLREFSTALRALEWLLPGVLPEMVSQVAAFFEERVATLKPAPEV